MPNKRPRPTVTVRLDAEGKLVSLVITKGCDAHVVQENREGLTTANTYRTGYGQGQTLIRFNFSPSPPA